MLFDDISRIARDLRLFLDLRDTADELGIRLESPMMTFDNSSGNVMSGNIQAVFAEHQRLQKCRANSQQNGRSRQKRLLGLSRAARLQVRKGRRSRKSSGTR